MRNVLLNLMVILSVFSVHGCWAGVTKDETSKDEKSRESDSINATTAEKENKEEIKRNREAIVVTKEKGLRNPKWCGSGRVIYHLYYGVNEIGHDSASKMFLKNIDTNEHMIIETNGFYQSCSSGGEKIVYKKVEDESIWIKDNDLGEKIKISNKGGGAIISPDGGKIFIRDHKEEVGQDDIYKTEIKSGGLKVFYFNEYVPLEWLPNSYEIIMRDKDWKKTIFNIKTNEIRRISGDALAGENLENMSDFHISKDGSVFGYHGGLLKCHTGKAFSSLNCKEVVLDGDGGHVYAIHPDGSKVYFQGKKKREIKSFNFDTDEYRIEVMDGYFYPSEKIMNMISPDGSSIMFYRDGYLSIKRV